MQNILPKHPFFSFTLETVLKIAKQTNKEDVESIYRSQKVVKAEDELN